MAIRFLNYLYVGKFLKFMLFLLVAAMLKLCTNKHIMIIITCLSVLNLNIAISAISVNMCYIVTALVVTYMY